MTTRSIYWNSSQPIITTIKKIKQTNRTGQLYQMVMPLVWLAIRISRLHNSIKMKDLLRSSFSRTSQRFANLRRRLDLGTQCRYWFQRLNQNLKYTRERLPIPTEFDLINYLLELYEGINISLVLIRYPTNPLSVIGSNY